jgi:hypothetical protein
MPEIKIGLAPGRNGFYDPNTNLYLSLSSPVQVLTYSETTNLEKITHALLASVPALVLYQGVLRQDAIDAWKAKFDKIFKAPVTRKLVENGKVIGEVPINYAINYSVQDAGRLAEGNRAFDRTDELEQKQAAVVVPPVEPPVEPPVDEPVEPPVDEPIEGATVGEAEIVTDFQALSAEPEKEEAPAKKEVAEKKKPAARSTKKAE